MSEYILQSLEKIRAILENFSCSAAEFDQLMDELKTAEPMPAVPLPTTEPTRRALSMEDWLFAHRDQVFRYWVYKKYFTPYEMEQKFEDESLFLDDHASFAYLREAVELGDGDWLLGFSPIDMSDYLEYRRLSDIALDLYADDSKEEENE